MKIKLDDASGLPEALQSLVTEGELDLAQVVPAQEVERWKGKAVTAEQEAIERRQTIKAWKTLGETREAVQQALADAQSGKSADHERIIAEMKAQHEAALQGVTGQLQAERSRVATEALKAELAKAGVVPEGLDLLANFASSRIQFGDDGAPRVMAADGKTPMVGGAANGGATLADLAVELAKGIPHLVRDAGHGGGGKQPGSGGTPGQATITRTQFDGMSQAERVNFSKSGGKVVNG